MTTHTTKLIASIAVFAGASGLLGATSSAFAAESVKVTVNGMVCAFCAQGIEKGLSQMPASKGAQ